MLLCDFNLKLLEILSSMRRRHKQERQEWEQDGGDQEESFCKFHPVGKFLPNKSIWKRKYLVFLRMENSTLEDLPDNLLVVARYRNRFVVRWLIIKMLLSIWSNLVLNARIAFRLKISFKNFKSGLSSNKSLIATFACFFEVIFRCHPVLLDQRSGNFQSY